MDNKKLVEYIKRAMQLEVAIYTQEKLGDEYNAVVKSQCPQKPKISLASVPVKPKKPERNLDSIGSVLTICFLLVASLIFLACGVYMMLMAYDVNDACVGLFSLVCGGAIICFLIFGMKNANESYKMDMDKYQAELNRYENARANLGQKNKEIQLAYDEDVKKYDLQIKTYNENKLLNEKKQKDIQIMLETALKNHYDENIIFPKYRNLIAISAFYDYLQSGRCDSLEGANGAYNLYEMELRQNIVINQLALILEDIDSIRNNQYTLYQELNNSNIMIKEILQETRELRNDVKLSAYYNNAENIVHNVHHHLYATQAINKK